MLVQSVVAIVQLGVGVFALVMILGQLVAKELGYLAGRRVARHDKTLGEGVGVVVGGMLGLLAFVLALTLSFSSTRFQERRDGTLAEANAIGTAWLQAQAVGGPRGEEIARLLEDYAQLRRRFILLDRDSAEEATIAERTSSLQNAMWGHVTAIVREQPTPVTNSLMNALNNTFDLATSERFAFALLFPPQLFWLLVGMSLVCMSALGFQLGLRGRPLRVLTILLLGMWTATTTVILDMGSARLGGIRVGTQAYDWTIQGFQGGITIPPAPR